MNLELRRGVLINPRHITASFFINDNESGLLRDFENWLEKLAPKEFDYRHHLTGEDNGFAHLWRTIMGRETIVSISDGELDFGVPIFQTTKSIGK